MPRLLVVVNPISGRGTGGRMIPVIREQLNFHGVDHDMVVTERPWHAAEVARQAPAKNYECVVAAGGDGTINEVINGLILARGDGLNHTALGVLTVGRGNDFGYSMGIPHDISEAVTTLVKGVRKRIDIGHLEGGLYPRGRSYGNGVGIGFDAVVGFESLKLAPLSGFTSYLVAAVKTMALYFNAPKLRIELDDEVIEQPALMVSVMNGRRMGGGFYMAPESRPNDGKFDLCIAGQVKRHEMLALMLRFMKGTQAGHPAIRFARSQRVLVTALNGKLPAHADGETVSLDHTQLSMQLIPSAIDLMVPNL